MRVEQEQRVTEDARRFAEQDAEAQRYAANVLQVIVFPNLCFMFFLQCIKICPSPSQLRLGHDRVAENGLGSRSFF